MLKDGESLVQKKNVTNTKENHTEFPMLSGYAQLVQGIRTEDKNTGHA